MKITAAPMTKPRAETGEMPVADTDPGPAEAVIVDSGISWKDNEKIQIMNPARTNGRYISLSESTVVCYINLSNRHRCVVHKLI